MTMPLLSEMDCLQYEVKVLVSLIWKKLVILKVCVHYEKGVELVSTILGLDVHITNKHNKQ